MRENVIAKEYKHEFCTSCFQENPQDQAICNCGGRGFIYGDSISVIGNKVVCDCGSDEFDFVSSVNMSPIHNMTYKCSKCKAIFGKQLYIE